MFNNFFKKKKYNLIIILWLLFIVISYSQFHKLSSTIDFLHTYLPETSNYELKIETALALMLIAIYLMLSLLITLIKNNKIKAFYYTVAVLLIGISPVIIDQYYFMNANLTSYMQFFNPSLLPFMIAIVIFMSPILDKYFTSSKSS